MRRMAAMAIALAWLFTLGADGLAGTEAQAASRVVRVPTSIDYRGNRDVSSQLRRFISRVPNNTRIVFRARGVYRLSRGIKLLNRHNLVLDGNGATLRASGCLMDDGPIVISDHNSGSTIRNFTLRGSNANGGTSRSHNRGCEHQAGISIFQSKDIEIVNVTITHTNGDCLYIDYGGSARVWVDGVVFRDSVCRSNGRQGVAVVAGRNITVKRVRFDKIAMNVLDIEPNTSRGGGVNVRFIDNRVGTYSIDADWDQFLFAMSGANGTVRNIRVERNRVTGGTLKSYAGINRSSNITFRNNTSTRTAQNDPVVTFRNVAGLVVTGNRQPMRSGTFARILRLDEGRHTEQQHATLIVGRRLEERISPTRPVGPHPTGRVTTLGRLEIPGGCRTRSMCSTVTSQGQQRRRAQHGPRHRDQGPRWHQGGSSPRPFDSGVRMMLTGQPSPTSPGRATRVARNAKTPWVQASTIPPTTPVSAKAAARRGDTLRPRATRTASMAATMPMSQMGALKRSTSSHSCSVSRGTALSTRKRIATAGSANPATRTRCIIRASRPMAALTRSPCLWASIRDDRAILARAGAVVHPPTRLAGLDVVQLAHAVTRHQDVGRRLADELLEAIERPTHDRDQEPAFGHLRPSALPRGRGPEPWEARGSRPCQQG